MAKRRPFYLYLRHKKHGDYWYVCYINPETGRQENARSIDCLKEKLGLGDNKTTVHRDDAALIAYKALEAGIIYRNLTSVTFASFCQDIWNPEGEYVRMRNRLKPGSLGLEYCKNMECNLRRHVLPFLPEGLLLNAITPRHLDKVLLQAFDDKLANGTIQMIVLSFSLPLKEAVRQGILAFNPSDRLYPVPRVEKARGVLTNAEIERLLEFLRISDMSDIFRYAILLAIITGMRSGEIRALQRCNIIENYLIRSDGEVMDKIIISESIAPYSGVKCTKGKYSRSVLVDHSFSSRLLNISSSELIFPSNKGDYLSSPSLRFAFYEVLDKIGIKEEERKRRNITFHSLRHFFSTFSKDEEVSLEERMLILGHRSGKVNERYTHISDKQLEKASFSTSALWLRVQ